MSPPRRRMASALALMMAIGCVAPRPPLSPVPKEAPASVEPGDLLARVVEAHNAERGRRGLSPLTLNPQLTSAAASHARDMADRRKMSHRGGDGSSPFDRMGRAGYRFQRAAENVAFGFDDVESVMTGWMKSPGHRRNILGDFREVGVGRAIAKDGASYWSVTFGTPMSP